MKLRVKFSFLPFAVKALHLFILILPTFLFLLFLRIAKPQIYFTRIVVEAIGHFSFELDLKLLKTLRTNGARLVVISVGHFSNLKLKELFELSGKVIFLPKLLSVPISFLLGRCSVFDPLIPFEEIGFNDSLLQDASPPLVQLSKTQLSVCKDQILQISPEIISKPLVLICCRDSAFDEQYQRDTFQELSFRNSNIESFSLVANYLYENNYMVIRMGSRVKEPLSASLGKLVFDYPNSQLQNELMDIFLFQNCSFVLSTEYGLDELATVFRKPVFKVNSLPLSSQRLSRLRRFVLPKTLICRTCREPLTLDQIYDLQISNAWKSSDYLNKNVEFIDNSPQSVLDFVIECLEHERSEIQSYHYTDQQVKSLSRVLPSWWIKTQTPIFSKFWKNLNG